MELIDWVIMIVTAISAGFLAPYVVKLFSWKKIAGSSQNALSNHSNRTSSTLVLYYIIAVVFLSGIIYLFFGFLKSGMLPKDYSSYALWIVLSIALVVLAMHLLATNHLRKK